jgi:hypothetical protein
MVEAADVTIAVIKTRKDPREESPSEKSSSCKNTATKHKEST